MPVRQLLCWKNPVGGQEFIARIFVAGFLEIRLRGRVKTVSTIVDCAIVRVFALVDYACKLWLWTIGCLGLPDAVNK